MKTIELDTRGKLCPFPLVEAKKQMALMTSGDVLVIDYDCGQATENLPRWAAECGHQVTEFEQTGDACWRIQIRKG
ncbi:MAG: sulfurtransferase TusA family protein [Yokenella regensburgei]|uniref:Selenium metabolism protein YedF n=1 Tax=Yokenella regensburgei TaxID=158877 RepID=A0AB38FR75_9ENTR|nr:sulfurtransferase TusA family protein [Yokenella regensburgei]KFD19984.1 sulfurtransferase [Yokenella regensburgei ATCC 49455]MDQ4431801.1 sulfurtransferase TusA family protein [Yokenella regensburgei]MDR3105590.1 sulfurtransferase TusA family protein [Yokenella regensburgei]QIU88541.1 sulfurtransferase TusA family protein [Yokenella regensburgei]RKR64936.1 TusA-related sulfurtransferase [Yokenella regensburgei]